MVKVKYKVAGGEATATFPTATTFWANSESGTLDVIQQLEGEQARRGAGALTIAVFAAGEWIYVEQMPDKVEVEVIPPRWGEYKVGGLDSSELAYGTGRP